MEVQITHVGSLPFLKIDEALDYTFKFDIPVLFTLPKLDPNDFMGKDVLTLMGVSAETNRGGLALASDFQHSKREITLPYEEEFFKRFEQHPATEFKCQLIGPITLYLLLENKEEINFEDLKDFLLNKYEQLLTRLGKKGKVLFMLDEPMLFRVTDKRLIRQLADFVGSLNQVSELIRCGVHACCKLDQETQKELKSIRLLNLDFSLYEKADFHKDLHSEFMGISPILEKLPNYEDFIKKIQINKLLISPSCGLALKNPQENINIFNDLQKIRNLLLERNRE